MVGAINIKAGSPNTFVEFQRKALDTSGSGVSHFSIK
jgi:hypothetical protein